jgi:diacylglycerol kinase family enzyme
VGATHLLVGNPTAQSGKAEGLVGRARDWLAGAGVECDLVSTMPGGGTIGAVRDALDRREYRVVLALGGDGTFRETAAGLLDCGRREEVALAMLPTGTANDQGRSFGLDAGEEALERNLEIALAGRETRLDAGRITAGAATSWFFDSAGWGISARVLAVRNRDRRWVEGVPLLRAVWRDKLVYAGALLRTFLESYVVTDKFDAEVVADGERVELTGLTDLIVKGTRVYGGAWVFDRTSRHDDGQFEVVPFQGKRDWMSKALVDLDESPVSEDDLNEVGIRHSRPFRAASIGIRFTPPADGADLAAQIDGEEFPATLMAHVEVVPRALRLVVPDAFLTA